jgi:molybdenum cofactor cytidylyltransferase
MKFGPVAIADAVGGILAHATPVAGGVLKKGHRLSPEDIAALKEAGIDTVVVARLETDDVPENDAAQLIAQALAGLGITIKAAATGRANVHAETAGLVVINIAVLHALNRLHEGLTIATLPHHARVVPGQMVATIKIIPFALERNVVNRALALLADATQLRVAAFQPKQVGLVITRLPGAKASLVDKSERAMADRLVAMGSHVADCRVCDHTPDAVATAIAAQLKSGCAPILVIGAAAIVDRGDVIPQAVITAGGEVLHLGMPVDPGNLLMLAAVEGVPVVGVPSCARSPKLNGFDWVLERLMANIAVTPDDLMAMGHGGLLAEIPSRPSPRERNAAEGMPPRVAALVLAAGLSSRMGENKLLLDFDGQPVLAATLEAVRKSSVAQVVVVTGRDAEAIAAVAQPLQCVENPDHALGMASSIRVGMAALADVDGVVICLGDMPLVSPRTIDALIAALDPAGGMTIVVPTHQGRRGNPVLWGRTHFARLQALTGDAGARQVLAELHAETLEIAVDDPGILADADTPDALDALRQIKVSVRKLT